MNELHELSYYLFSRLLLMSSNTDTLGALAVSGRGRGMTGGRASGRGIPPTSTSTQWTPTGGRGSTMPQAMLMQQQHTPHQLQHQNHQQQVSSTVTQPYSSYQSSDTSSFQFPPSSPYTSQSLHSSSQQPIRSTGDNSAFNKKIVDLLVNIVNILTKQEEVIKRLDERTSNIDANIYSLANKDYINNLVNDAIRPIADHVFSISAPGNATITDDDTMNTLDDILSKTGSMTVSDKDNDKEQDNQ